MHTLRLGVLCVSLLLACSGAVLSAAPLPPTIDHRVENFVSDLRITSYIPSHIPTVKKAVDEYPYLANSVNQHGRHVLTYADKLEVLQYLVEKGADPKHPAAASAMYHLAPRLDCIGFLIAKGISPKSVNSSGQNALWNVTAPQLRKQFHFFLVRGVDPKNRDENGRTLLHSAAETGDLDLCKLLVSKGLSVNAKGKAGDTPLHCAVIGDQKLTARFLLDSGAKVQAEDNEGLTPLDVALRRRAVIIEKLLRQRGAK